MNLDDVLHHFGNSKADLARCLGITRQSVNSYRKSSIPKQQVLKLKYEVLPAIEELGLEKYLENLKQQEKLLKQLG